MLGLAARPRVHMGTRRFLQDQVPHLFLNKKKASMRNRAPGRRS
ncbi:hypothetical protein Tco_0547065, partial [Tanacetum coccineum]